MPLDALIRRPPASPSAWLFIDVELWRHQISVDPADHAGIHISDLEKVVDARITGSFNWSTSAAHTNDETLLVIHSPQLAKHFTREMDRLWDGAELGITARMRRKLNRQKIRCGEGVERR